MTKYFNREKVVVKVLQKVGNTETPDSTVVTVVERDGDGYISEAKGTTVPTNGEANYATGCDFVDTDASAGAVLYVNEGDETSCDFNAVGNDLPAGAVSATEVADSDGVGGLFVRKVALAVYDFSVDGGAIGAIVLADAATLPDNAVVTGLSYDVLTTLTSSGDNATLAVTLPTDGAISTAIAIDDVSDPWDAGAHLGSDITPLAKKTTDARAIGVTVAVEAITAGKVVFAVEYFVSQ